MKIADTLLIFSIVIASNGIPSLNAGGGTGAQSVSGEAVKTPQNGITSVHMKDLPNEREVLVYFTGRTQGEVSDIAAGQMLLEAAGGKFHVEPSRTHAGKLFVCATNGKMDLSAYL